MILKTYNSIHQISNAGIPFLYVLFSVCLCLNVEGQTTENPDLKLLKADEASILTSLLHIVDTKFDTLSSRMSSLETAVNGLQFYNLRQFKIINNNLQGVNTFIQGVHGKLTQFDIGNRAVKIVVDILEQDLTEFTESNKQLMEDMSKEMAAIDKSVHEKTGQIKDIVEIVEENLLEKIALAHTSTTPSNTIPDSSVESSVKCDVNTTALQKQIDARFSEMRNFAHRELVQLHNVSRTVYKIQNLIQNRELVPQNLKRETNKINPLPQQEIKPRDSAEKTDQKVECSILENERLFKALSNITANIIQSVSYFRHTGGLFEELITNTDSMAVEQSRIRQELEGLRSNFENQNFTEFADDVEEVSEVTSKPPVSTISKPEMIVTNHKRPNSPIADRVCSLSVKELNNIMTASKNESKLLTVVTQLVLNTSVSLSNTLIGLQDELYRLQEMKTRPPQVPSDRHMLDTSKILRDVVNQTKQTYKMVRIIASNTGWMPHTFQRVGSVGEQINKSLELTQHLYGDFYNIFDLKPHSERERNRAHQEVESSLSRRAQTAYGEHYVREGNISSLSSSPLLDLIFNTNKELKRIMPALTRLIAEPEPLFSLMNGGKENEGRLEVYYHGQWATMCGANLNNQEASFICRSLAYSGGVASKRGSYGPGSGAFRSFNKTCIRSQRCPVITESRDLARCNHAEDLGIVCDHMVRVVDNDGYISRSRGRLQLYHQGKWRPVCSRGWKESEVRTACRQLGYSGGRLFNGGEVKRGTENLFVTNILCEKESDILHTCDNKNWMMSKCTGYLPIALVCQ